MLTPDDPRARHRPSRVVWGGPPPGTASAPPRATTCACAACPLYRVPETRVEGRYLRYAPHRRRRQAIREGQTGTGPPGTCQGHLPVDQPVASSAEVTAPALRPPLTPPGASAAGRHTPPPAPPQQRYVTPFPSPHGRGGWRHDGWPLTPGRGAAILYGRAGARSRCRLGPSGVWPAARPACRAGARRLPPISCCAPLVFATPRRRAHQPIQEPRSCGAPPTLRPALGRGDPGREGQVLITP